MSEPSGPIGNCLPADLPRSIVSVAFLPATATAPALCCATKPETGGFAGRATVTETSLLPLPSLPLACGFARSLERPASQSAAPHSSQYRDPARFCVPHLSQVIIAKTRAGLSWGTTKARARISYRETVGTANGLPAEYTLFTLSEIFAV